MYQKYNFINMESIIRELIIAAQGLDNRGKHSEAEAIDKVAESLVQIKTAQYDGTQGYFIRNTRCWNGCVRKKRADGLSPNDSWSSCHEEWIEAFAGKNTSSWDKYAEDDSMTKTAGVKLSSSYARAADEALRQVISKRLERGIDIEDAIPMTLAERAISVASQLSKCAEQVDKIANATGIPGISEALLEIVSNISEISAEEYVKSASV